MKKIKFLYGFASALLIAQGVLAATVIDNDGYGYSYQRHKNETIDCIQASGAVSLNGTRVLGSVNLNGSLSAEKSSIGSLQVNGHVNLNDCVIEQSTVINGSVVAQNTHFQSNLSVATQKIVLNSCSLHSLTIREVEGFIGMQTIEFLSDTTVAGPIVVESGNGQILVSSNSKISESQVSGAVIMRR